jgi:hypothetical protein
MKIQVRFFSFFPVRDISSAKTSRLPLVPGFSLSSSGRRSTYSGPGGAPPRSPMASAGVASARRPLWVWISRSRAGCARGFPWPSFSTPAPAPPIRPRPARPDAGVLEGSCGRARLSQNHRGPGRMRDPRREAKPNAQAVPCSVPWHDVLCRFFIEK